MRHHCCGKISGKEDQIGESSQDQRQHEAEKRRMADKLFEEADRQAEEWRTREIARDIVKKKINDVAQKKTVKEARLRLEKEMEMVLVVEKLQELRSLRIQKLKTPGHLFPEDDDAFTESVRAAVEAEERQAGGATAEAFPANAEEQTTRNPSTDDENTIKEVRRGWDTYIAPGGSRTPGHWVQPVAPSSEAWASFLINRENVL
ncbi:U11/U12 small nuclear ribonucleoprotein 59 kDa protein [Selaginella moellendorffii]|uniref:U11/U12 small nuclear ribonucleoprotein 59 kDa protein n=1 Tax=Selaginella moellendorffii TaxID=88036 RepID=UPI000D1C7761|nr:U11/U12 small nuclear ribonucleoprotein 59 kDa protein [Selaginella moellendorffii]|eukprot:XP_024529969.1 U11/U12 small nuclear ribonucleoprotein 59 kDa protein [Selaginella moellendorffii]